MKSLHLITVGKLRDKAIKGLEDDYSKRIKEFNLKIHEVKTHEENLDLEANEVLKKITEIEKAGKAKVFLLAEKGKERDSVTFSKWLYNQLETSSQIIFIIGGASGHGEKAVERSDGSISLSLMTYPHQLARLLFIEQIYRAQTIRQGHPYNK